MGTPMSQKELQRFEIGRRDGFKGIAEQDDDPIYLSGWREGVLEKLLAKKEGGHHGNSKRRD